MRFFLGQERVGALYLTTFVALPPAIRWHTVDTPPTARVVYASCWGGVGPSLASLTFVPAPASTQFSPPTLRSMIVTRSAYTVYTADMRNVQHRVVIKRYASQERVRAQREVRLFNMLRTIYH